MASQQRQGTSKAEKMGLLMAGAGRALVSRRSTMTPRPAAMWQRRGKVGCHDVIQEASPDELSRGGRVWRERNVFCNFDNGGA